MPNDETKTPPTKLKITIKDSRPSLSEENFNKLLKTLLADLQKAKLALQALFVIAFDKISGKPFPLLNKQDFFKLYVKFMTHPTMLTEDAKEISRAIAQAICQSANLAELYEIYEILHVPYIKSYQKKIGETYREDDNLQTHLNHLGNEQLRHEEGLNSFARNETYVFFDKIAAITLADYLQQLNIIEKLEKHLLNFNKSSQAYLISKEIIIWFEKSGLEMNDSSATALKKCREALDIILKAATTDNGPTETMRENLRSTLNAFKKVYQFKFQLSLYAVPRLTQVNQRYNYGLIFNASRPAQQLPLPLRGKSHLIVEHFKNHFKENPNDHKIFNTDLVKLEGNPNANLKQITNFELGKVIQNMGQRGFAGFILDWHNMVWTTTFKEGQKSTYMEDDELQLEKPRITNLFQHYDVELLVEDFEKLYALPTFQEAIQTEKDLKLVLENLHSTVLKFIELTNQSNQLKMQLATQPSLELFGKFSQVKKQLIEQGGNFKVGIDKLNVSKLGKLIDIIDKLGISIFGISSIKIGELDVEISNFYCNTAINFFSFVHRKKQTKPLWSALDAVSFGSRLYRNLTTVLQEPVLRLSSKYIHREKPQPTFSSSIALKALQQNTDLQTQAIEEPHVPKLYLNFCEFDKNDKEALEDLTSKLSKLTKEQKNELSKVDKSVGSYRKSLEDNDLQELSELIKKNPDDPRIALQLQSLICHAIATSNKELYEELFKTELYEKFFKAATRKDSSFWETIFSKCDPNTNHTPIHSAVLYNHGSILKDIFKKFNPQQISNLANLSFISENGTEKFSLLSVAASRNHTKALKVLLANGAKLDTKNGKNQRSTLELAAEFGSVSSIRILLKFYFQALAKSTNKENLLDQLKQDIENAKKICSKNSPVSRVLESATKEIKVKEEKKPLSPKTSSQISSSKSEPHKPTPKKSDSSKALLEKTKEKPKTPPSSHKSVAERVAEFNKIVQPPKGEVSTSPNAQVKSKSGVASNAQLISQHSGVKHRLKDILHEAIQKRELSKEILAQQNPAKLWDFVIAQIDERKDSDNQAPQYEGKNLVPILNVILEYLLNNKGIDSQSYINRSADAYETFDSCKKFIDKLDKNFVTEVETATKYSRTESFEGESGSDLDSLDSETTLSDSGGMSP